MAAELEEGKSMPGLGTSALKTNIEYDKICFALSNFTPVYYDNCQIIFDSYATSRSDDHRNTFESAGLRTFRLARDKFIKFLDAKDYMHVLGVAFILKTVTEGFEMSPDEITTREEAEKTSKSGKETSKTKSYCKPSDILSEWKEIWEKRKQEPSSEVINRYAAK